jgi:hypothetical protein
MDQTTKIDKTPPACKNVPYMNTTMFSAIYGIGDTTSASVLGSSGGVWTKLQTECASNNFNAVMFTAIKVVEGRQPSRRDCNVSASSCAAAAQTREQNCYSVIGGDQKAHKCQTTCTTSATSNSSMLLENGTLYSLLEDGTREPFEPDLTKKYILDKSYPFPQPSHRSRKAISC